MKWDEFAFLNQQLAGMLRAGIPLEGGLRELSASMRRGKLRTELEALRADLEQGMPVTEALSRRKLPDLYVRLAQAGVSGGDLPGTLTLLADYYDRLAATMTRLKGLMVYPLIVLIGSLAVSILISVVYHTLIAQVMDDADLAVFTQKRGALLSGVWLTTGILGALALAWICLLFLPVLRRWSRWRLPGFRETSLAQFASTASLLLRGGAPLDNALGLLQKAEGPSPAGREMARWLDLHRQGQAKFTSFTANSRVFPPLFLWLVSQGGEDMAAGFQRASEIYSARAAHKTELLLYAVLPVSIIILATLIIGQIYPIVRAFSGVLDQLGL